MDNQTRIRLVTDIDEIRRYDERFQELTKDMAVSTGSIFLLSSSVWHRWGVELNPENESGLRLLSEEARLRELSKREGFPRLEELTRPPMRRFLEERMAPMMGSLVNDAALAIAMKRDKVELVDMPARNGLTSKAIMIHLDPDLSEVLHFNLVDNSKDNIQAAVKNMKARGATGSGFVGLDTNFLDQQPDESFDIVVTLSHLHHQSFLVNYLKKIHRILREDGILIIGDRYSAMLDHPKHTFELLPEFGADQRTIDAFLKFFGEEWLRGEPCRLTEEELQAISDHREYLGQIVGSIRRNRMDKNLEKVCFLEAYETSSERENKLEQAGFTTDPAVIRKAFPSLKSHDLPKRMMRGRNPLTQVERTSDFAAVMAAVKQKKRCV